MKLEIEFFHDPLCPWCYTHSPRIHRLSEEYPEVHIVHRCFAMAPNPNWVANIFGSNEEGKKVVIEHWRAANFHDQEQRINPLLMQTRTFDYPYSTPGLLACKAAELQGGQEAHWRMFDKLQERHLTKCLNINDNTVLLECARESGLYILQWEEDYCSPRTLELVEKDIQRAIELRVFSTPTLVANGRHALPGISEYDYLRLWVEQFLFTHPEDATKRYDLPAEHQPSCGSL